MDRIKLLFLGVTGLLGAVPLAAQAPVGDADMHEAAAALRPGQFAWRDGVWSGQASKLVVSIALQRIYLYRGDALVGVAAISTGRRGHATPLGGFSILQKARWHRSNLYSNAPMPFMQRLTWTGIALHAGQNPGYPASHGCVRLPGAFARDLFSLTEIGSPVTIADYPAQLPIYLEVADSGPPSLGYASDLLAL